MIAPYLPLLSFAVALAALFYLVKSRLARWVLDHPNQRSLHDVPVPRTGGLAVMGGVFAAAALLDAPRLWPAWGGAALLFAISLLDDVFDLPVALRFAVHFVAAGLLLMAFSFPWWGALCAALAVVWMLNLYNFMDGADGLAGGMALSGFGFYALAAWGAGDASLAWGSAAIAAAAAAFLLFNFHPAKIFLGDAGSVPLGFLAATFGLLGWRDGNWPLWFPLLVFSPFIADASVTLVKRLLRGEKVWRAHRDHYYQRLILLGWGHRNTALLAYAVMLAAGGSALAALRWSAPAGPALGGAWMVIYFAMMAALDRRWKAFQMQQKPRPGISSHSGNGF